MSTGKRIFKRDTNGTIRTWNYEVDGDRWRSHSGVLGGAVVTSGWTTCVPKSRDTAEEQALFEAEAEMGKKLDKDYAVTEAGVDEPRSFGPKVMLAHKFEGWPGECFSQPKLDGIRCKVNRHGMWSRTGKPILGAPHIFAILAPAFVNKPDLEFDGELYNHELKDDFNKIVSMVRKSKPEDDDILEASKLVQYHVYDLVLTDKTFSQRDQMLDLFVAQLPGNEIVKVPTSPVATIEQLDRAYGTYLEAGYEGQIIRLDGPYENKRSKQLLKRKEFETREFELIAVEPGNGNWAGLAKRIRFRLDDGRECGGGIRGTREQMAELLARPQPKIVTVRYFTPTPDGMPRFPVAIDFDRPD
ncbi:MULTISPECIES: hypothetical protein [Methylobacterium]|jgi:DNA ligase-1|uniref:Polydeoxyribonucleotide synthase [ATP] n=2 Tax=Pseudomonadota TaxID=1224 RepID=A0ABQ4T2G9_9HYPH|nr:MULTISPECIES: hypothetical protein [Methylobacterium]PIU05267.1 MAG: hypothetical protein COT56_15885 [Methylobacterium sp. CG09_land_8_20_14_0_10_71_15]PIU12329.1 MAG: hypothetical protein COT28_15165 [Methylobacterium sp. CG08_land_8_20_14_0_20_71_15]GBU16833.1 hypothetical protein AwMethylo_10480 [Methylobacterium sp.]GJE08378.1 DNA ligase [Methylobacterium jeotgali]